MTAPARQRLVTLLGFATNTLGLSDDTEGETRKKQFIQSGGQSGPGLMAGGLNEAHGFTHYAEFCTWISLQHPEVQRWMKVGIKWYFQIGEFIGFVSDAFRPMVYLLLRFVLALLRPYSEIAHGHPHELTVHRTKRLVELKQFSAAQLQGMLIRLIDSSDPIVQIRRACVFDVIPKNMRHRFILAKLLAVLRT